MIRKLKGCFIIGIFLALTLAASNFPPVVAKVQAQELPVEHWSYSAVRSLAETPLLEPTELNFTYGVTTITRFEMALLVSKVLNRLEAMGGTESVTGVDPDLWLEHVFERAMGAVDSNQELNKTHLESIRRLIQGFDSELESLGIVDRFLPSKGATDLFWNHFSFSPSQQLLLKSEPENGLFALKDKQHYLIGDSIVQLNDRVHIGGTVATRSRGGLLEEETKSIGSIGGTIRVAPDFVISGGYAGGAGEDPSDSELKNFGAVWQIGDLELGAKYRSVNPGSEALLGFDFTEQMRTRGYDFTVRVGDILIRTSRDTVNALNDESAQPNTVHSMGVSYDVGSDTVIRADYSFSDVKVPYSPPPASGGPGTEPSDPGEEPSLPEPVPPEFSIRRRAAIGVGVDTPTGSVEFGLKYEGDSQLGGANLGSRGASAGVKYPVGEETVMQAGVEVEEGAGQSSKSLSLGFVFQADTSLLVGYKMIDFESSGSQIM